MRLAIEHDVDIPEGGLKLDRGVHGAYAFRGVCFKCQQFPGKPIGLPYCLRVAQPWPGTALI